MTIYVIVSNGRIMAVTISQEQAMEYIRNLHIFDGPIPNIEPWLVTTYDSETRTLSPFKGGE